MKLYTTLYNGYIHIQQHFDFCSHSYKFASGDVLLEGGKPNPDAYILCDGSVEILKDGWLGVMASMKFLII